MAAGVVLPMLMAGGCSVFDQDSSEPTLGAAKAGSESRAKAGRQFYASTGLGVSRLEPDTSAVNGQGVDDAINAGGQITVGADMGKRWSMELHSADLGSAGLSQGGRINYHVHGGSALWYAGKKASQRQGLKGFGRVGVALLENSAVGQVSFEQQNDAQLLIGAGVEYGTKSGLGVRAEVIAFEEAVQYGQLGLIYRVGGKQSREAVTIAESAPADIKATEPPQLAAATHDCTVVGGELERVGFSSGSWDLDAQSKQVLNRVVKVLEQCDDTQIELAGHTDAVGGAAYNLGLASRRAASVSDYLKAQGLSGDRINSMALGESQPLASNATAAGKEQNRRVEVLLK